MEIREWAGLITNCDPHDLPVGAARVQNNLMCITPGVLEPRKGLREYTFPASTYAAAAVNGMYRYQTRLYDYTVFSTTAGKVYYGGMLNTALKESGIATLRRSCWCSTRLEDLIRINGLSRGTIFRGGTIWSLGITAPAAAPSATPSGGGNTYAGTYKLAYRYKDANGTDYVYSSLSAELSSTVAANQQYAWTVARSTEPRVTHIELYRTTADQPDVFYLVTTIANPPSGDGTYTDTKSDDDLLALTPLPVYYEDGSLCARRQELPPDDLTVVTCFQDRYWYANPANDTLATFITMSDWQTAIVGKTIYREGYFPSVCTSVSTASSGALIKINLADGTYVESGASNVKVGAPLDANNAIWYSEPDEPESVPAEQNMLTIPDNVGEADQIVGLIPNGATLLVAKNRYTYRVAFTNNPARDGAVKLVASRGMCNPWCWATYRNTVFMLDRAGPWAISAEGDTPIGDEIRNYWRDSLIDFAKIDTFFVSVDPTQGTVRFHVHLVGDGYTRPAKAFCYSIHTQKWWTESYPHELGGASRLEVSGEQRCLVGGQAGKIHLLNTGTQDNVTGTNDSIEYQYRSGIIDLPKYLTNPNTGAAYPNKHVLLTYKPTISLRTAILRILYDHNASTEVMYGSWQQDAVSTIKGSSDISIEMKSTRSTVGNAPGVERFTFQTRVDERALSHRYVTLELAGEQTVEQLAFYGLTVEGLA